MDLPQLWSEVDSYYNQVTDIAYNLIEPYTTLLTAASYKVSTYANLFIEKYGGYAQTFDGMIANVFRSVEETMRHLVKDYIKVTQGIKDGLISIYNSYFKPVILRIKQGVDWIWYQVRLLTNDIMGWIEDKAVQIKSWTMTKLADLSIWIDDSFTLVYNDISTRVSNLWDDTLKAVAAVKTWMTDTLFDLKTAVWDAIQGAYEYIATEAQEIYQSIADGAEAIKNWTLSKIGDVTKYVLSLYKEIKDLTLGWIEDLRQKAVLMYEEVKASLVTAIEWVSTKIETAVHELKDLLNKLSGVVDWRFQFLNLFMIFPEISLLTVLNRESTFFDRYKPYWQALFLRVMED